MTATLPLIRSYLLFMLRTLFTDSLIVSIDGLRLRIFSDDLGALEENSFTNVYFNNNEEIRSARTIVDLGAHQCSFTVESIIKASPGSTIIAVKPNPIATKLCLDNIKAPGDIVKAKSLKIKGAQCTCLGFKRGHMLAQLVGVEGENSNNG